MVQPPIADSCAIKALKRSAISAFQHPEIAEELARYLPISVRQLSKGKYLHVVGEEVLFLHVMKRGWITSQLDLADGERQLLNFHVPYDLVNMEYLGRATAGADLVAFEDSEVISVSIMDFKDAMVKSGELSRAVTSYMSRQYGALQTRLSVFANGNAVTKVAHLIHGLRSKFEANGYDQLDRLDVSLTQSDIADTLGLTNVTVSRAFAALRKSGCVDFKPGQIHILDHNALLANADGVLETMPVVDRFG